jgi:xylulose-5-phosphate/fructose-6-phosphate phosphoketolase
VLDNPNLLVACVIGDGESETGPLSASWHSNKILSAVSDGAVIPILHLNGFKISNPTILSRISREEVDQLFRGLGWLPIYVEGSDPELVHQQMAFQMEKVILQIKEIQIAAREKGNTERPRYPMIILRTPKGK